MRDSGGKELIVITKFPVPVDPLLGNCGSGSVILPSVKWFIGSERNNIPLGM